MKRYHNLSTFCYPPGTNTLPYTVMGLVMMSVDSLCVNVAELITVFERAEASFIAPCTTDQSAATQVASAQQRCMLVVRAKRPSNTLTSETHSSCY